jgi:hypothetical protein
MNAANISNRLGLFLVFCASLFNARPPYADEFPKPQSIIQSPQINEGIARLRAYQMKSRKALGIVSKLDEKQVITLALEQAKFRETLFKREGDMIRSGSKQYHAEAEQRRWQRTRAVIQRVVPGLDEDPVYLEILARQAASIEMAFLDDSGKPPGLNKPTDFERYFLGTVPDANPEAFSQSVGDYALVVLSDGFISFLYQAAKSVVLSWRPVEPAPGSKFSFRTSPEDIAIVLGKDPYAQELLYRTLWTWLTRGHPRAVGYNPPPEMYRPALEDLITFSERFSIAHEYAHALYDKHGLPPSFPARLSPDWFVEYRADQVAFVVTAISGLEIDELPPNLALQGAYFVLTALDIKRKAVEILRCGHIHNDTGSESHPPLHERIQMLQALYKREVGSGMKYDVPVERRPSQKKTIDLGIEGALIASETLSLLWGRIEQRFYEANHKGEKLHDIWGSESCD